MDCKHRLSDCAFVGHAWEAAASAASKDIHRTLSFNDRDTYSIAAWLQKHGGSTVQSIALTFESSMLDKYANGATIQLPIQELKQLRHLEVVNSEPYRSQVTVVLEGCAPTNTLYSSTPAGSSSRGSSPAASSNSGSPPAASSNRAAVNPLECVSCSLTSLKLHSIKLQPSWDSSYGCITALTALQLQDLKQPAACFSEKPAATLALTGALPQLMTLTKLCLEWQFSKELKAAVGQLTKLQELRLRQQQDEDANPNHQEDHDGSQLNLSNSLTHLEVHLPHSFSKTYTPSLSGITALQHLQLKDITDHDEAHDAPDTLGAGRAVHVTFQRVAPAGCDACNAAATAFAA
jgi:hypothetical protein